MQQFHRVLDKNKSRLMGLKNVCGTGVGYKQKEGSQTTQPCIIVFVEKKEDRRQLTRSEKIPPKIGGVETDVIEIGRVRLLGARKERMRPAQPGVSIGHHQISAGTFGAVVKDKESGEPLILSNNHILAAGTNGSDNKANIGDPILQPGGYVTQLNK